MTTTRITEVPMYKTEDGCLFTTIADAENHLVKAELIEKIDNAIYCRDTSAEDIAEWIVDNLIFTYK